MKTIKPFIIGTIVTLMALPLYADHHEKSYIGVLLDSEPLPPLLSKHLGLAPDQGLRIRNLHRGGPADRAGLERDDIITLLNGEPIFDFSAFAETISQTGVGNAVTLEIIHLGRRREVEITLAQKSDGFKAKYPPEPQAVRTWQPGKMFHFDPHQDHWIELDVKPHVSRRLHESLSEQYEFHYTDGQRPITVSIVGDPHDEGSSLTCKRLGKTYRTTVGKLADLPVDLRETAERAIKEARKDSRRKTRIKVFKDHTQALRDLIEEHPVEEWRDHSDELLNHLKYFVDKHELPKHYQELKESHGDRLKSIEDKLDRLYRRFERLETGEHGNESRELNKNHEGDHEEGKQDEEAEIKVLRLHKTDAEAAV